MPRNAEVVRQWTILRSVDSTRHGHTINDLAGLTGVTTRTIRRDLEALQESGFPIYDDMVDGKRRWKIDVRPFRALTESGFTLSEACALYFSRSFLETLAGGHFGDDLHNAFGKIERVLTPPIRRFLDRLPSLLVVKGPPVRPHDGRLERVRVAQLLDAALHCRRVAMRYHSYASNRVKDYRVDPHRVVYGQGALYLIAFVPEYGQMRTFAVDRIKHLSVLDERFTPTQSLVNEVFPDSLGVYTGNPVHVELEFEARVAPYIRERRWHSTQAIVERPGGRVRLSMDVCDDLALRTWILGFGSLVRVIAPPDLASRILEEIDLARDHYRQRLEFDIPLVGFDRRRQRMLPFGGRKGRPKRAS